MKERGQPLFREEKPHEKPQEYTIAVTCRNHREGGPIRISNGKPDFPKTCSTVMDFVRSSRNRADLRLTGTEKEMEALRKSLATPFYDFPPLIATVVLTTEEEESSK